MTYGKEKNKSIETDPEMKNNRFKGKYRKQLYKMPKCSKVQTCFKNGKYKMTKLIKQERK